MRTILVAVLAVFIAAVSGFNAVPASAQSLLEVLAGIKFCRTLKDDAQRLKCFDGIASDQSTTSKSSNDNAEAPPAWEITEKKSPLDDSPTVVGALSGNKEKTVGLILRCMERKTDVIFSKQFAMFGIEDRVRVLVRINEDKPIDTKWPASTSHTAVFAPSPVQFIRALPDNGKLYIRAFGYNGAVVDGEFRLGKVSDVREKIAQACNWPNR